MITAQRQRLAVRLAASLLAGAAACRVPAEAPRVVIEIFPETTRGAVSPYIFGAGIDHKTNPMRYCRYPAQVERDIGESGLRIARYPGGFVFARDDHRGSWKNFYWQDHIGQNPGRNPLYTYDLDTFVQMCERFGIEPLMQINFAGEPEESLRGYIEYLVGAGDIDGDGVDWAAKRAANGRAAPYRIRYWQLGNEVHDFPQGYRADAQGAREYAAAVNRLVPLVRKLAPDARIVAPFINIERPRSGMFAAATPGKPDINLASGAEFARAFLAQVRVRIDYLDWHFYSANGWDGSYPFLGTDDEWKHYYCWGTKFRECYAQVAALMQRTYVHTEPPPRLIVGEWSGDITGMIFPAKKKSGRGSMERTMASAVYMADILIFMMEESASAGRIHAAFWHNLGNGAQELFSVQVLPEYRRALAGHLPWKGSPADVGYWPTWPAATPPFGMGYTVAGADDPRSVRMPVYHVFRLLSEQRGDDLVETRSEAPGNDIAAPRDGLYHDPDYHFARVVHCATRRGDDLYLAVLNKDAHQTVELRALVHGWRVASAAQIHSVGAPDYLAQNTIADPERVVMAGPDPAPLTAPGELRRLLAPSTLMVARFSRLRE